MADVADLLAAAALLVGATLMLLAALGVVRMPDVFTRMQASTKAASLGSGLAMLGVAIHFAEFSVVARAALIVVFIFLTAPIAAHMLARAAYFMGVEASQVRTVDDLAGRYDHERHELDSPPWARR